MTDQSISQAAKDVIAERQRQIKVEDWVPEHDDQLDDGSLAIVAAVYALHPIQAFEAEYEDYGDQGLLSMSKIWPESWDIYWFKPTTRRRDLVKAGALIIAEIERLDRAEGGAA